MILMIGIGTKSFCQLREGVFEMNYLLYPNGSDNVSFNKTGLTSFFSYDFNQWTIKNTTAFKYYQLTYPAKTSFNTDALNNLYNLRNTIGLNYKPTKQWELYAEMGIGLASNFHAGLSTEDVLLTGGGYLTRKWGEEAKPSGLSLGAGYYTYFGKPEIYPVVSYFTWLGNDLSIEAGFPKSEIAYHYKQDHLFKANLDFRGVYVNLSGGLVPDTRNTAEKAEINTGSLGLEYEYRMDDTWSFSLGGGYMLNSNYNLNDSEGEELFSFNINEKPFFTTGVKFNIKTKSN